MVPLLFIAFAGIVQLIIFLQSIIVTNYAAFAAGRAFHVYGNKKLSSIDYPHLREQPYTNKDQTISEAAAEKVIFESLLWENQRISMGGDYRSNDRYYQDGNQEQYDGQGISNTTGAVQVNFNGCQDDPDCKTGISLEVLYCMPVIFPGAELLFGSSKKKWPCKVNSFGKSYDGIGISKTSFFKREPLTK